MTVKLTFRGQEKISASTPIDSATMCQEDRVPATFLSLVLTRALAVHQGFTTPRALKLSDIFRCCSRVRIAVCCAEEDAFPDKRAVQCHRLRAVLLLWQGRCTELALGSDSVPNLEEPRKPKTNGPHDRGHFNGLDRLDSENRVYAKETTVAWTEEIRFTGTGCMVVSIARTADLGTTHATCCTYARYLQGGMLWRLQHHEVPWPYYWWHSWTVTTSLASGRIRPEVPMGTSGISGALPLSGPFPSKRGEPQCVVECTWMGHDEAPCRTCKVGLSQL